MAVGLFGFSLVFELLVLYFAFHLLWEKTSKHWFYLILVLLILVAWLDVDGARWAEVFQGDYSFVWTGLAETLGFR